MGARRFSPLRGDRIVIHNVVVSTGTLLAGVLGFAFQALVSHRLQPNEYGAVFAVVTLITLVGLPANALTLLMAREASLDSAHRRHSPGAALLVTGNRVLLIGGLGLAALVTIGSPWIARFLNLPGELLLVAAAGLPFGIALPLLLGQLLGNQRFAAFAFVSVGQAALKLIGALALGSVLGAVGVVAGISAGSALIYLVAARLVRLGLAGGATRPDWRTVFRYLAVVLPSTLALTVLFSADLLLVKHFFDGRLAGQYAAVSALGRAIFWAATGVAGVLFPKVIFREARGGSGSPLVLTSLLLAFSGGLVGLLILSLWANQILQAFAGHAYAEGSAYLPWYAVGMTLLGAASVLISTHQSRGKGAWLLVLLPLTCLEPLLIIGFHQTLIQVVQVVDGTMAVILVGLTVVFVLDEANRRRGVKLGQNGGVHPDAIDAVPLQTSASVGAQ